MKAWTRFEDWINALLGAYLFFVPALFGTQGDAASSWNAYIVGVSVVIVALIALAAPASRVPEWTNVVLGVWLIVAPFALGFAGLSAALWNAIIVGVLVITFAGIALARMGRTAGTGGTAHRGV
jgi:hypothetical protein